MAQLVLLCLMSHKNTTAKAIYNPKKGGERDRSSVLINYAKIKQRRMCELFRAQFSSSHQDMRFIFRGFRVDMSLSHSLFLSFPALNPDDKILANAF